MRIIAARLHPFALPLRARWRSAGGQLGERRGWLLELVDSEDRHGWGECAPLPTHGSEDHATAIAALTHWCDRIVTHCVDDALNGFSSTAMTAPAARAAIECALLDLQARTAKCTLAQWLSPSAAPTVAVNAAAGALEDAPPARLQALAAGGFSVIKLKLGLADPDAEIAALREACRRLPDSTRLRLDANAAWDMATALRFCRAAAALPVESLEEPLRTPTLAGLRALQETCAFPLAIDESWSLLDHDAFFAAPPVRRLTLKLAAQGGILPAAAIARQARAAGVACIVTSGIDGACGTLAAAHLAASLEPVGKDGPGNDGSGTLAHGLATSDWLEQDNGVTPTITDGRLQLPTGPGLGFEPLPPMPSSAAPASRPA